MNRDFPAFCYRQAAKMTEYARDCTDLVLKTELLQMSSNWLNSISVPNRVTKHSTFAASPKTWL